MGEDIKETEPDYDASKGRFLVLKVDGTKVLQTHCWHDAKRATDNLDCGSCWRLPLWKGAAAVQVLP